MRLRAARLTWEAWILFAILFLWQFPHFYAIAWMYREDYERAGIRMLPVVEPDGESTARRILLVFAGADSHQPGSEVSRDDRQRVSDWRAALGTAVFVCRAARSVSIERASKPAVFCWLPWFICRFCMA